MLTLTLAQANRISQQLEECDPPADVIRAVKDILTLVRAGGHVPQDLAEYVTRWIAKRGAQDQYGK